MASHRNVGLDIIRTLAIGLVMFVHGSVLLPEAYRPGPNTLWLCAVFGVEVFFCLSGYLIGRILVATFANRASKSDIFHFLARRWLRTLPLYFFVLGVAFFVPGVDPAPAQGAVWYLLLLQNFAWPLPGYWFGISWSLTIEEWSYLLLPFIAYLAMNCRRPLLISALLLVSAGFFFRLSSSMHFSASTDVNAWDQAIRKIVLSRLDAIAYGMLIALYVSSYTRQALLVLRYLTPFAFAAVFGAAILLTTTPTLVTPIAAMAVFPMLAAGVSAMIPTIEAITSPWRSIWPMEYTSRISYSLYLIHGYTIHYCLDLPGWSQFTAFLISSMAISTMTYYCVELTFLRMRPAGKSRHTTSGGPGTYLAGNPSALR